MTVHPADTRVVPAADLLAWVEVGAKLDVGFDFGPADHEAMADFVRGAAGAQGDGVVFLWDASERPAGRYVGPVLDQAAELDIGSAVLLVAAKAADVGVRMDAECDAAAVKILLKEYEALRARLLYCSDVSLRRLIAAGDGWWKIWEIDPRREIKGPKTALRIRPKGFVPRTPARQLRDRSVSGPAAGGSAPPVRRRPPIQLSSPSGSLCGPGCA